jgi:predicted dehydrogenase
MRPINWGVLGAARIAVEKVVPAMQQSPLCRVQALASRDVAKATTAAATLGIPKVHDSYEALLADPDIDAVYIPLPNHLHVPWAIRAAEAGKHVLCEKPIGLNAVEVERLIAVRDRAGVHIEEAFMIRHHPQWLRARELVRQGAIGELRALQVAFSFYMDDPVNYRSDPRMGGGGIYDIGCYPVVAARFLFDAEPRRVFAAIEYDPALKVDRLASGVLEFAQGQASFVCSIQMSGYQRVQVFGSRGRIEIEVPFNAPPDRPCRIFIDADGALADASRRVEVLAIADQYRMQGEAFARTARGLQASAFPLEDALANMRVLDALFRAGQSGSWQAP